jgi:hypothetical protein
MFYCTVTSIKNWILGDPLIDYLNSFIDKSMISTPHFKECNFTNFIMDMGNKYEEIVVNNLIEKCNKLNLSYTIVERKQGYHQTKNAISKNTDIIFQAQVKDWDRNIIGYPDIIVTKNAFLKLFKISSQAAIYELSKVKDNHYIVIDVKYSTIDSNNGFIDEKTKYHRFIRSQIAMYTNIGKFKSNIGFIISKDLQTIDSPIATYTNDKCIIEDYEKAISWLIRLYKEGKDWNLETPSIPELYPNMNNVMDGGWREYKQRLAINLKEVSLINGIGDIIREKLQSKGVYTYDNPSFVETLQTFIDKENKTFNRILNIRNNILNKGKIFRSLDIKQYTLLTSVSYIYVDIETCNKFDLYGTHKTYLTSISFISSEGNNCFIVNHLSEEQESIIIARFKEYLESMNKEIVLVHYSPTEDKFFKKHNINYTTLDLYSILINEFDNNNQNIKDICEYDFSLKSISSKIQDVYGECKVKNGLEVLTVYQKDNIDDEIKNEIIKYNIADCEALKILHSYFIKNSLLI